MESHLHPREYEKLKEASGKPASNTQEPQCQCPTAPAVRTLGPRAPPSRYLRTPAAAAYPGLSTFTLAKMRLRGDGPPYSKSGARIVVYDVADLDAYLAARLRNSTSEAG